MPCRAGGRAAAAPDAESVAGNLVQQLIDFAQIGLAQVEGACPLNGKSEICHITIYM